MFLTMNQFYLLFAVSILGDNAHGNKVAGLLLAHTSRPPSLRKSVYLSLQILHSRGLVDKWVGGTESPRPYYSLTPRGIAALKHTLGEITALSKLAPSVLAHIEARRPSRVTNSSRPSARN